MKTLRLHIFKPLNDTKRYSTFSIRILFVLIVFTAITSCALNEKDGLHKKSDLIPLNIHVVPTSLIDIAPNESNISELKAIVYIYNGNDYVFDYLADIHNIYHGNGGYTNLSMKLFGESRPVKITIIANANDAVTDANPLFGETETTINNRINTLFTTSGISQNIPMWAEFSFANGISSSLKDIFFGAKALRTLARIDIDASHVVSTFEMTSIQAYRANSAIQLIPNNFTKDPLKVDEPSIPGSSSQTIHTQPLVVENNLSTSELYLPESIAPDLDHQVSGATCIVVGGKYNGSPNTTYYRLDFEPPASGHQLGQILRNHQYTFNITSVNGPGWSNPDEAANNVASPLMTSVLDWSDNFININIGGFNNFVIYTKQITLTGDENNQSSINFDTDIRNCSLYWSNAAGTPIDNYIGTSITNEYFVASITSSEISVRSINYNDRGNGVREQYVTVIAGRLRIPIQIIQEENVDGHATLWAARNVGAPGAFANRIEDFGGLFQWNSAISLPVNGSTTAPIGWNSAMPTAPIWEFANDPCPSGWRMPTSADWAEFLQLYPAVSRRTTGTIASPGNGTWFAPTQAEANAATFANPGNAIFFPSAGWRTNTGSHSFNNNAADFGFFWAVNRQPNNDLSTFSIQTLRPGTAPPDRRAFSIRCIRDL